MSASIWDFSDCRVLPIMESDGAASSQRCSSGGGGRSDRSSSTQGVYIPIVGEERDGVAPKCHCRVYATLYLSKTASKPNRLFFGCPFFRVSVGSYLIASSLSGYTAKFGEVEEDVKEHLSMINVESRVTELESRVAATEKKKNMNVLLVIALFVMFVSFYVVTLD
ncbi:hypothetical protein PIB30_084732 [Stylosanthes scabra]|uniref:Zinc finger GRF-type domain-containing protein n=1 Tax=Stylosanthes scabra TaxID=79078 RepID=A0ABU6VVX1_9FABA|nr:hypothetical protein [Stylosanthes scabra]